jgi:hypothetical protein
MNNICALMKTQDKWQKLAKQTNDPVAWSAYRNYKHEVRRELRLAQKAYVEDQIQQNPNDVNTAWKTIRLCMPKRLINTKNYSQDEKSVANEFNNFSTSIGEVTRQKVQSLANEYGHISSRPCTLIDHPI